MRLILSFRNGDMFTKNQHENSVKKAYRYEEKSCVAEKGKETIIMRRQDNLLPRNQDHLLPSPGEEET